MAGRTAVSALVRQHLGALAPPARVLVISLMAVVCPSDLGLCASPERPRPHAAPLMGSSQLLSPPHQGPAAVNITAKCLKSLAGKLTRCSWHLVAVHTGAAHSPAPGVRGCGQWRRCYLVSDGWCRPARAPQVQTLGSKAGPSPGPASVAVGRSLRETAARSRFHVPLSPEESGSSG